MKRGGPTHEEIWRGVSNFAQAGRIVLVGPFQQMSAESRQFAQLFFQRFEVTECLDAFGGWARHPGADDLSLAEAENNLRRMKLLEQEAAGSRTNASHTPQRQ